MENTEHITAEWARKTAETQLGVEAKKQLETCLKKIAQGVKDNVFSVGVAFYASKPCVDELIKRGFKVNPHSDQMDGDWTTITW